ncbi:hypothetical protein ABPG75_005054 [Micractinium tetrahymenae]
MSGSLGLQSVTWTPGRAASKSPQNPSARQSGRPRRRPIAIVARAAAAATTAAASGADTFKRALSLRLEDDVRVEVEVLESVAEDRIQLRVAGADVVRVKSGGKAVARLAPPTQGQPAGGATAETAAELPDAGPSEPAPVPAPAASAPASNNVVPAPARRVLAHPNACRRPASEEERLKLKAATARLAGAAALLATARASKAQAQGLPAPAAAAPLAAPSEAPPTAGVPSPLLASRDRPAAPVASLAPEAVHTSAGISAVAPSATGLVWRVLNRQK